MENGTNHENIFQWICRLNTTILEAELVKVPMVREKGTKAGANRRLRTGIKIRLAPPPQMALIQKEAIVAKKSNAAWNATDIISEVLMLRGFV